MASITITFTDDALATASYKHDMNDTSLNRIVDAYREIYAVLDEVPGSPTFGQMVPLTRAQSRKKMSQGAINGWKDGAKRHEQLEVAKDAAGTIPEIPITEVP